MRTDAELRSIIKSIKCNEKSEALHKTFFGFDVWKKLHQQSWPIFWNFLDTKMSEMIPSEFNKVTQSEAKCNGMLLARCWDDVALSS